MPDKNELGPLLNQRPRKTLGFETPASKLQASVASRTERRTGEESSGALQRIESEAQFFPLPTAKFYGGGLTDRLLQADPTRISCVLLVRLQAHVPLQV